MSRTVVRARFAVLTAALMLGACSGTMDGTGTPAGPEALKGKAAAGATAVQQRGCAGCHSSSAGAFAGAAGGKAGAANLTPDAETGLGEWKDEDIISAIRDGIDDEQHTLCSSMPRSKDLSDEEAANIVAYLRSLKPVSNEVPEAECMVSKNDSAHHGKKVVEAQHCAACHGDDLAGDDGSGGGEVFAANLTPDLATGLGGWSKQALAAAITKGTDDEGGMLCSQMPRFANLTENEVTGVAEYLATVAPVKRQTPKSTCGSDEADPVKTGKEYATNRKCTGCHTASLGGRPSCGSGEPSNLTGTNLGKWSDQQIITATCPARRCSSRQSYRAHHHADLTRFTDRIHLDCQTASDLRCRSYSRAVVQRSANRSQNKTATPAWSDAPWPAGTAKPLSIAAGKTRVASGMSVSR